MTNMLARAGIHLHRYAVLGAALLLTIVLLTFVPFLPSGVNSPPGSLGHYVPGSLGIGKYRPNPSDPLSEWAVPPELFIGLHDTDILGPLPAPTKPKRWGMKVPNVVHYVYGLKPVPYGETPPELPYYAYLGMRSALLVQRPDKIYFHYKHKPTGPWWDLIEPHLRLIETKVPDRIFNNPLKHFAHKADLVRLWVLKRMGGIYLDIDMFVLKPLDDLLYAETTMGMEASPNSQRTPLEPTGLCNGLIIAAPKAKFVDNWLKTYVTFSNEEWAQHSVAKPWELAQLFPTDIQVLNTRAMFWPMWSGDEIQKVHELDEYNFYGTGQYGYHAWESLAMKYLEALTPDAIMHHNTSFHRMVRPFVGPTDSEVYRKISQRTKRN